MTSNSDLFVLAIARQMRDKDVVHVGASQVEIWQAAAIAKRLWAPNLRLVAAGTYHLSRSSELNTELMASRTYARDIVAARQATFHQSRVFDDLQRSRVSFPGAMQIDARGNANLIAVSRNGQTIRGPGSGGLPTLTSHTERFYITSRKHDAKTLVQTVDRISVLGDPALRARNGFPPNALQQVITPLASFAPGESGLELVELAPEVALADVERHTDFPVVVNANCRERQVPSRMEAEALNAVNIA